MPAGSTCVRQTLLRGQDDVVARSQLLGAGLAPHDVRRLLRRRELVRVHPGVYLAETVWWHLSPPRRRPEHAALDVASEAAREWDAVAVLASTVQAGLTTANRLAGLLDAAPTMRGRGLLREVLADVADGSCSVLEREYVRRVARPHGLPLGTRQAVVRPVPGTTHVRDVDLPDLGLVVELDGRLFHADPDRRDRDLERDLLVAAGERVTIRRGWGQVLERSCTTARRLGEVFRRHGWRDRVRSCRWCRGAPYVGATG